MAQLYYKYGTMNSGKTIEILKVAHNYEEQGKPVVIMTSALDTRDGYGIVSSRIGMRREAVAITDNMDIFNFIKNLPEKPYCVLIDESQFLSKENVNDLARVVDDLDIPVMAFGLKNDFQNHLFEGSRELLLLADKIEEIKTICQFCSKKSNHGTSNRKWKTSLRRQSDPNWRQRDLYPSLPQALFPTSDRGY